MPKTQKGFTLIELVITAIVIAILVTSLYIMLQKVNMRSRDAIRLSDMANLFQAIQATVQDNEDKEKLYYLLCNQPKTPCEGKSYPMDKNTQNVDGSGWLKVMFTNKSTIKYAFLPLDPLNNEEFNYNYTSDGKSWKLTAKLESSNFKNRMIEDGGADLNRYELTQKLK